MSTEILQYSAIDFTIKNKLLLISIKEVMSGNLPMPFLQRRSWIDAQSKDQTHITLRNLINNAKAAEKKKTKNENTMVKLLYNIHREGKLKIHKDGLAMVKYTDQNETRYQAVSVPTVLFPGIMFALHYKLDHPSKLQLTKLVVLHFYTPG